MHNTSSKASKYCAVQRHRPPGISTKLYKMSAINWLLHLQLKNIAVFDVQRYKMIYSESIEYKNSLNCKRHSCWQRGMCIICTYVYTVKSP